jgi:hypothetical protein
MADMGAGFLALFEGRRTPITIGRTSPVRPNEALRNRSSYGRLGIEVFLSNPGAAGLMGDPLPTGRLSAF